MVSSMHSPKWFPITELPDEDAVCIHAEHKTGEIALYSGRSLIETIENCNNTPSSNQRLEPVRWTYNYNERVSPPKNNNYNNNYHLIKPIPIECLTGKYLTGSLEGDYLMFRDAMIYKYGENFMIENYSEPCIKEVL